MTVAAVIPAYNEEKTIREIIEVLKETNQINKIIVVNDGSTDNTYRVAKKTKVKVINLRKNIGKGGAMKVGFKKTNEDIILFLDADLIGLTKKHIEDLISPVLNKKADMSLGVFVNGKIHTDIAHKITPFFSGQRAVKRELFSSIDEIEISRYGVEMALTKYVKKNNIDFVKVKLQKLTHVTQEEKFGLIKGFCNRMKMYWDILKEIKLDK